MICPFELVWYFQFHKNIIKIDEKCAKSIEYKKQGSVIFYDRCPKIQIKWDNFWEMQKRE